MDIIAQIICIKMVNDRSFFGEYIIFFHLRNSFLFCKSLMVMDPNKAEEHVLRSLQQALAKKKEGNVKDYARVLKALEASPPATLVFWFRSLVKCITLIEPSCYELVQLLLRYRFNGGESANAAFEK